eukprot:m.30337 g.30337  ORF g.30337 m.30337 type:complete len:597 (+) comp10598_c0_seq1:122-1912(+)
MATFAYKQVLVLPPAEDNDQDAVALDSLSELIRVEVQAVGKWFEEYNHRRSLQAPFGKHADTHTEDADADDDQSSEDNNNESTDDGTGDYVNILGEWKDQDHYALLGLQDKRWKATQDDIKKAYRKMVLKHHPDKKNDLSETEMKAADEYFNRIQKAYELLSNENMRRLYDSVDDFDDDIPDILSAKQRKDFFEIYGPVFERNAKFVIEQPVPPLGDNNTAYDTVASFYNFWSKCTSWREFGYEDDEYNLEEAECREERRWMERQNKNARKKKKKAEVVRLRKLVDNAYASDPRIKRELQRQKEAKEEAKRARQEKRRQEEEERDRQRKQAEEAKRLAEEEAKASDKKAKEQAKKIRRAFTKACKRAGIYDPENPSTTPRVNGKRVLTLTDMETLKQLDLEKMQEICAIAEDAPFAAAVFGELATLRGETYVPEEEPKPWNDDEQKVLEDAIRAVPKTDPNRWDKIAELVPGRTKKECVDRIKECMAKVKKAQENPEPPTNWTEEEEVVLTKAASKVFPPGTQGDRWAQIAEYLQIHAHTAWRRPSKQVIAKVNAMKNVSAELKKKQAVTDDFKKFEQTKKKNRSRPDEMDPSRAE